MASCILGSTIELEGEAACVNVELDKSQNKIEIQGNIMCIYFKSAV